MRENRYGERKWRIKEKYILILRERERIKFFYFFKVENLFLGIGWKIFVMWYIIFRIIFCGMDCWKKYFILSFYKY